MDWNLLSNKNYTLEQDCKIHCMGQYLKTGQ